LQPVVVIGIFSGGGVQWTLYSMISMIIFLVFSNFDEKTTQGLSSESGGPDPYPPGVWTPVKPPLFVLQK